MTLVEAREINPPANQEPLHWRLLTSREVGDAEAACEIVRLYRLRWRIAISTRHGDSQESSGGWIGSATRHFGWNIMVLLSVPSESARQIGKR